MSLFVIFIVGFMSATFALVSAGAHDWELW